MNITERVHSATEAIFAVLQTAPSDGQRREVARIVQQAVINSMLEEAERSSNVAMTCCSADLDLAHKIADGIHRDYEVLIANLSSLR